MSFVPKTSDGIYVISECGINWNSPDDPDKGSLNMAHKLIAQSAEAGADYIKFQLYDPDKIFPGVRNTKLRAEAFNFHIDKNMWKHLVDYIKTFKSTRPLASVFDLERLEWCEELGLTAYKIASRSVTDKTLCQAVIATEKPVFMSLGMWDWKVKGLPYAAPNVYYLECISKYPASLSDLARLEFDYNNKIVGLSDHTVGMSTVLYAISRGAHVIEKHFTWDVNAPGSDHVCSMVKNDLEIMVKFAGDVKAIKRSAS